MFLVSSELASSPLDLRSNTDPGEDALANLSIEKESEDGPVTGFVRIRSRSQGLALSLGSLKGLNKAGETAA